MRPPSADVDGLNGVCGNRDATELLHEHRSHLEAKPPTYPCGVQHDRVGRQGIDAPDVPVVAETWRDDPDTLPHCGKLARSDALSACGRGPAKNGVVTL